MKAPDTNHRVSYEALHRFTTRAFQNVGMSEVDAKTGADVLDPYRRLGNFHPWNKKRARLFKKVESWRLASEGQAAYRRPGTRVGHSGRRFFFGDGYFHFRNEDGDR